MKLKTKLIATLMSLCLVVALGVIGIFAVKTLNMSVGGNITFAADGISFTVGNGKFYQEGTSTEYANITNQTGKLQGFAMNTNTKLSDVQGKIDSWAGLELALDSKGDAELKFTVTNNMATEAIYLNISTDLGTNTNDNMNIVVTPSVPTINANQSQEVSIKFDILDTNINAGLAGFEVAIEFTRVYSVANGQTLRGDVPEKYKQVRYNMYNGVISVQAESEEISGDVAILGVVNIAGTNYQVTTIGDQAFEYSDISSISIPNTITTIGSSAFHRCEYLSSVIIPNSVTVLGSSAFAECFGIVSLTLSNKLTRIGSYTFYDCAIKYVKFPQTLIEIDEFAFVNCSLNGVEFEETSNWYSYTDDEFSIGETLIDVSNTATNATNLKNESGWGLLYLKRKV